MPAVENLLELSVMSAHGDRVLTLKVQRLWNRWAGRDQDALRRHIRELEALGIPPPTSIPILFRLSRNLATTADEVEVLSDQYSGEVEFILLMEGEQTFVTVGSDHTDRAFERYGIQASKQLYPDVIAPEVWPYEEVRPHWEQLILRCWVTVEGRRRPYQEASTEELITRRRLDAPTWGGRHSSVGPGLPLRHLGHPRWPGISRCLRNRARGPGPAADHPPQLSRQRPGSGQQ